MGGLTTPHQSFQSTAQEMAVTLLMLILSLTVPMGAAAVLPNTPLCTNLTKSPKQLLTLKQGLLGFPWLIYNPIGYGGHPLK